jgi:hypothetical protein
VIRYVRDGKARVLKESRRSDQAGHGQVSLGRRNAGPEEAAHQRACRHVEVTSQEAYVPQAWRAGEDSFEKVPAVIWHACQVDCQLAQYTSLTGITGVCHEGTTKLAPASGVSDIDEASDTTLAKCQHRVWRPELEFAEKCDGWDARKFADE